MEVELQAYATEAVLLRDEMQIDRTRTAITVDRAATDVARYAAYNRIIAPTVEQVQPGDATRIPADEIMSMMGENAQGPMPLEMFDLSDGQTRFVQVGTAGQIDNRNCFVAHQSFFVPNASVIYMTALGLNLRAGTSVRVEWRLGGSLVHTSTWTAPQSIDGQCVALALRPENAQFTPGNWTATMYVNGEPIDPAPFTITSGM